ncbi:aminotransferase class V-fold PLP-dependent enzyme [Croceicoccus sp. F390]|uniref:Cysteine desulfurase n=1 Tax=Croceicoccus esteveae TaxID=3075597 RepID=A0ABU2ZFZ4_9SPHN|nr:aminotransferase class V-fold PLP-dependent enzyme [Croceicoccus sp. F390]MDT0574998.1 aminotransferase class V-fold PLP-dependent enzyme [Croceicoccus sp. F390]
MVQTVYLDHAASAPLLPDAMDALRAGLALDANPSSPHRAGRAARAALEEARGHMAEALDWDGLVIFTSGASEALAMAMTRAHARKRMVSAVEHEAVSRHAGQAVTLRVGSDGLVDCTSLSDTRDTLVCIQQVNNETGVIQALDAAAPLIRDAGGVLLADCAQSAGKIPLPTCDMAAISAHKFGGPPGIGALLVRDPALLAPSGGQERGYRGGTENVAGAMAMAAALQAGRKSAWLPEARQLRDRLESAIRRDGGMVVAAGSPRIATIGAYRLPGKAAAVQLIRLDSAGIAVSAGSACSSGSLRTSHVLQAMGMDPRAAAEVIRVSIGVETTARDIDRFVAVWSEMAQPRKAPA